jgi:hypothetical protein
MYLAYSVEKKQIKMFAKPKGEYKMRIVRKVDGASRQTCAGC